MQKRCFKCGQVKALAAFYRYSRMADGNLGKCKECTKRDVKQNYELRRQEYSLYEASRNKRPERRALRREYKRSYRERCPLKIKARQAAANALRSGRLTKLPCEVCGTALNVQAHHDDYSKPLDVRWLCFRHHRESAHGQVVSIAS